MHGNHQGLVGLAERHKAEATQGANTQIEWALGLGANRVLQVFRRVHARELDEAIAGEHRDDLHRAGVRTLESSPQDLVAIDEL